jgi:hypothetical protein
MQAGHAAERPAAHCFGERLQLVAHDLAEHLLAALQQYGTVQAVPSSGVHRRQAQRLDWSQFKTGRAALLSSACLLITPASNSCMVGLRQPGLCRGLRLRVPQVHSLPLTDLQLQLALQ